MLSIFAKRAAIAALLIAIFVSTSQSFGLVLSVVVCLGAWIACGEALRSRDYAWASLFLAVALTFSTVLLTPLASAYNLVLEFLCLALFVSSVVHVRELLPERVAVKARI